MSFILFSLYLLEFKIFIFVDVVDDRFNGEGNYKKVQRRSLAIKFVAKNQMMSFFQIEGGREEGRN